MTDGVALRMHGIRKAFPGVLALGGVDLEVRKGEVHVLLGENGAGKSTLVKILSGAHRKDAGRIWIDASVGAGQPREVEIAGPRHARALGVGIIYQELTLVPSLTAAENVFLGREPTTLPTLVDRATMTTRAQALLDRVGASFAASTPVSALGIAQRQLVEIARALSLHARILVMDEPTSALSDRETRALFGAIRGLTAEGVAVVYISHRLDEIFEIGDRVTVLRDGRHVATHEIRHVDRDALVRAMANRTLEAEMPKATVACGPGRSAELLRVERLTRRGALDDVSFTVHAGEIVGLAGLMGAGRTEVARAVFGLDALDSGTISVRGRVQRIRGPRAAIRAGIGFVTEDRTGQGLVLGRSIRDNVALPVLRRLSRFGVVRRRAERETAERFVRDLRIRTPSAERRVLQLSGGNQQKVVLAKWLACDVDVLILDEPTRGVDVGAKQEIYTLIAQLVSRGVGIVLISSELPEIVGLADRALVMRGGRVVSEFARAGGGMTQERLLAAAVGG